MKVRPAREIPENLEKWLKTTYKLKTDSALGIEVDLPAGEAGILFVRHEQKDCNVPACRQAGSPARRETPKNQ